MTVWYDFTTTVRNRGRSGIANVEWSLGQALLDELPELRCFELESKRGLVELDPAIRLRDAVYASSETIVRSAVVVAPTWRDQLRIGLRRRLGRRADPIIRSLSSVYQLPKALNRRRTQGWRRPRVQQPRPKRLIDLVAAGDVVISMGADWDGRLAEHLGELKRTTGCAVATMVYDLVPLTHTHLAFHNDPELFRRYYRTLLDVSDLITCISQQSRRDLAEFARDESRQLPRSEVLILGENPPERERQEPARGEFYLCVGTIERRKNIELVYDALRVLEAEGRQLPLVVVAGAPGWGTDDLQVELNLRSTAASRAMVLIGSVDDATLDRLYRTARALLFPSHFEGWGLPVREAAIRGCPVAAGDSPAIREAAAGYGGAVFLPSDDAGPWADFMDAPPVAGEPAPMRPWAAVARDLIAMVEDLSGARPSGADAKASR